MRKDAETPSRHVDVAKGDVAQGDRADGSPLEKTERRGRRRSIRVGIPPHVRRARGRQVGPLHDATSQDECSDAPVSCARTLASPPHDGRNQHARGGHCMFSDVLHTPLPDPAETTSNREQTGSIVGFEREPVSYSEGRSILSDLPFHVPRARRGFPSCRPPLDPRRGSLPFRKGKDPSIEREYVSLSTWVRNPKERTKAHRRAMPATHIVASDELSPMFGAFEAMEKEGMGTVEDLESLAGTRERRSRTEQAGCAPHMKLVWCVSGVFVSLTAYGLLQERIMTLPYGDKADMFTSSLFVVLCNRAFSAATALVALWIKGEGLTASAPLKHYASISISNVVSTYCQYEALKYVNFPLQTIFKSAKMAPVMVWSTLLLHRHYTLKEYLSAGTVTLGCVVFLLTGNVKSVIKNVHATDGGMFYGLGLLVLFLVADGYTSTYQERLFKKHRMSIHNQILHVTTFSSAISLILLAATDQLTGTAKFVVQHPSCMQGIVMISITATVGQLFISYTIQNFGSLLFATVMTTRQCVSLFLSCIFFSHPLSGWQWGGVICVFSALYFQSFTRNAAKR